ncbi:hypothetical protein ACFL5Y_03165 [Candidatus Omnitrophota bacterium]
MRKRLSKGYFTLIIIFLIISFINLTIAPSYLAMECKPYSSSYTLQPPPRVFDSIVGSGIDKEFRLEALIFSIVNRNFGILSSLKERKKDIFSYFGLKNIEILSSEPILIKSKSSIHAIPCRVDGKLYYGRLVRHKSGRLKKVDVYPADKFIEDLVKNRELTSREAGHLRKKLSARSFKKDRNRSYVFDATDESVKAVIAFLTMSDAQDQSQYFQDRVRAREELLAESDRAKTVKQRAKSMLDTMLDGHEKAFREFWKSWEGNKKNIKEFDLDEADPEFGLHLCDIKQGFGNASNEGFIELADKAYETMPELSYIKLKDCQDVINDIKMIFPQVANEIMEIYNEMVALARKGKKIRKDKMPGTDPNKVIVARFILGESEKDGRPLHCLLPTEITKKEKLVLINENFVKLLTKYREYLKSPGGDILDYDEDRRELNKDKVIGNLYTALIRAIAYHSIGGHFTIQKDGTAKFNPDELLAQGVRGGKHDSYVNLIALLFYWTVLVESSKSPVTRAEELLRKYPILLRNITPDQRDKLPKHFLKLCRHFLKEKDLLTHYRSPRLDTGVTKSHVENFLKTQGHPDSAASNEGGPGFLPARVYRLLCSNKLQRRKLVTDLDILEELNLKDSDRKSVSSALDALTEVGVVTTKEEELKTYKRALMSPRRRSKVTEILARNEITDVKKLKGDIYKVTEPMWAQTFLRAVASGKLPRQLKVGGQKIILALETDWIPKDQMRIIQKLIQEIGKLGGSIKVVRGSADELAGKLNDAIEAEGVQLKNVVVLAGKDTIKRKEFAPIRAKDNSDTDKAFFVGVDASELKEDSYIRLMEMLTMAMRMAFGQRPIFEHPRIKMPPENIKNIRTVIFTLKAEKIKLGDLVKIYDAQKDILSDA